MVSEDNILGVLSEPCLPSLRREALLKNIFATSAVPGEPSNSGTRNWFSELALERQSMGSAHIVRSGNTISFISDDFES
jgi:hypothetical protein